MNENLQQRVALMAQRLGQFLNAAVSTGDPSIAPGLAFLGAMRARPTVEGTQTFDRLSTLTERMGLSASDVDLLVLAGMPEAHEGFAAVFRSLHPRSESRPTAGLAAQLLAPDAEKRGQLRGVLETSPLAALGVIRTMGDGPFFERTIQLADSLWPVLDGQDCWPAELSLYSGRVPLAGLEEWVRTTAASRAIRALRAFDRCTIFVLAESEDLAFERGLALAQAAGRIGVGFVTPPNGDDTRRLMETHSLARGSVPVLRIPASDGRPQAPVAWFESYPDTAIVSCREGGAVLHGLRPILSVSAERLTTAERRRMWRGVMPSLQDEQASRLSAFSVEPATAAELALDLDCLGRLEQRNPTPEDLAAALRSRTTLTQTAGMRLIHPRAGWNDLVLPRDREEQLHEAVDRLTYQERVFDDWGFLSGRPGVRGVRMLFSGPPGTGKTYAAEVLARELARDLLVVDISRVVSKWIGETEKNLASVFDTAERAQAVCFFDEADALFGRRTEVSDAHDRYANLETAYLLSRFEKFEGLAILATNLRQNIDNAFLRRLEYVVDFDEPDREERFRIWKCHLPTENLLAPDVNLYEFAALYPVAGGFIRNAILSAAFLAASNGGEITRHHLYRAMRREYHKTGRPFPALPAGMKP